ncbi:MAG TPA: IS1634 family transposase [Solirubrobacteraceae bacterium]|nr:IS1634 family transposase [Solirubrobacteraceae bacterium]
MYLRTTRRSNKDGSVVEYLQLAHNVRDPGGQSKVHVVYNFGRSDQVDPEALRRLARSLQRLDTGAAPSHGDELSVVRSRPLGGAYALDVLWQRLGIAEQLRTLLAEREFSTDIERTLFALVANRCLDPASKLAASEWVGEDVVIRGMEHLDVQHAYRAMDFLVENAEAIQERVFFAVASLLNLEVDLLFFDTTSTYFEVEEEDELRRFGHSKDSRADRPQVVIGMAVTREGIPVRVWVFPGNTADAATVRRVKDDLRGWRLGRVVFVADRGLAGDENVRYLQRAGGHYIVGERMRAGIKAVDEAMARPGRYAVVRDNLEVKEVTVGDGEARHRYVVWRNPVEAERDRQRREQMLADLDVQLVELHQISGVHAKRACALRISKRFGRYVRQSSTGRLSVNMAAVHDEERLDGKYLLRSSDDTLSAEDIALGYKQLLEVERGWRDLKHHLDLRPVYHRRENRIVAHVVLCFLALLLVRVVERSTNQPWPRVRRELQRVVLVDFAGAAGRVSQRSELTPAQGQLFDALAMPPPARIWSASSSAPPSAA